MKTKVFLEKLNNTIRSQLKAKNQKANDEMTKAMPVKNNVGVETFPNAKIKKDNERRLPELYNSIKMTGNRKKRLPSKHHLKREIECQ